jgi:flagellar hook-associated protein 1 FlgK
MADIFGIGVSALNTAQYGLLTTEHNIANASTPGYSRQQAVQSTNIPQLTGAGFIGQGVNVSTVKRIFNDFLNTQLLQQQAQSSMLNSYYSQIQQINNIIADPVAGIQPSIQSFFGAVNAVASAPASTPARQAMLSSAQTLTSRFQSLNQMLTDMNTSISGQLSTSVSTINSLAQQIAGLNHSISIVTAGTNQPPNDLMDQRDQLVSQLNQQIQTTVIKQSDGTYSVFIGNGQGLVIGDQASTLQTVASQTDPTKVDIAYTNPGGGYTRIQQSSLQGGSLGGLLNFRDQTLSQTQNTLGQLAIGLASTFNQQNQLGQDLSGAMGGSLFSVGSPVVSSNTANTGTAVVSATISSATALTGSDYRLAYDGSKYTLTRLTDNQVTTSATLPLTVDGINITTSATPNAGDSFLIRPTVNGAGTISVTMADPSKIAAAVPVRSLAALANTGSGTITAPSVNGPPPANANLQDTVTITFNNPATTFNVVDTTTATTLASNVAYTAGQSITYNGWTTQISGTPATNDVFTVSANTNGTSDGNNALLMAGLQTKMTLSNGTVSYEGLYGQLVSQVGTKTNELQVTSQAQTNMVTQTSQAQQAVSGVNLDEEAANLIRYQQAYQAASKAIQIASTLFDSVLSISK